METSQRFTKIFEQAFCHWITLSGFLMSVFIIQYFSPVSLYFYHIHILKTHLITKLYTLEVQTTWELVVIYYRHRVTVFLSSIFLLQILGIGNWAALKKLPPGSWHSRFVDCWGSNSTTPWNKQFFVKLPLWYCMRVCQHLIWPIYTLSGQIL